MIRTGSGAIGREIQAVSIGVYYVTLTATMLCRRRHSHQLPYVRMVVHPDVALLFQLTVALRSRPKEIFVHIFVVLAEERRRLPQLEGRVGHAPEPERVVVRTRLRVMDRVEEAALPKVAVAHDLSAVQHRPPFLCHLLPQ